MMTEQWLPVVGWEGLYEVSDHGRVRSLTRTISRGAISECTIRGRVLKPVRGDQGRLQVGLSGPNGKSDRRIHLLVLEAFVGLRPAGVDGCHWDDVKNNNRLENLRWDTKSANMRDRVRNGIHHETRKAECKYGHEFTPDNTRINSRGARCCMECRRRNNQRRKGLVRPS